MWTRVRVAYLPPTPHSVGRYATSVLDAVVSGNGSPQDHRPPVLRGPGRNYFPVLFVFGMLRFVPSPKMIP